MFDFFRNRTWLLQLVLAFVVLAFVGGGVYQGYGSFVSERASTVATVDGIKITRTEWEFAQRQQIERIRQQMPNVDPKLFDTPDMKRQSLDAVVREKVMLVAADKLHLTTTDERLQRIFATDPQFASMRNPDGSVNKDLLAAQGMSSEAFAQRLRQQLSLRQVALGIGGTAIPSVSAIDTAFDALFQQREIQVQQFTAKDLAGRIAPTAAEIDKFYNDPANARRFMAPEEASIEYVVLDPEAMKKDLKVSDQELRDYYTANLARYTVPEERRASHILVKVDPGASSADRAKAKAKAETLLAEVKKDPASFAKVAEKNSDDPGSAGKGGDLDFFGRGGLAAKPLEDAAFALKPGEISGLVTSDFGYHIVELTAVRGGQTKSFESVKPELETEVRAQLAQKRYSERSVEFGNVVYEQPDSLKPAADKFNLPVQTAQGMTRVPLPGATGPLANPKFLAALFGNEALNNKHNTEAIETAPNTLVSGRVVKHVDAHRLPRADVEPKIREALVAQQSAVLARTNGEARLAALKAAPTTAMTEPVVTFSRARPGDLPNAVISAALQAPTAKLPAFVGVDLGDTGYAVVKINKVQGRDPTVADAARMQTEYAQALAAAESNAYYDALKQRYDVKITPGALTATNEPSPAPGAEDTK